MDISKIKKLKADVESKLELAPPIHWHPKAQIRKVCKGVNGIVSLKQKPDYEELSAATHLQGYIDRAMAIKDFPHLDEIIAARDRSDTGVLTSLQLLLLGCIEAESTKKMKMFYMLIKKLAI